VRGARAGGAAASAGTGWGVAVSIAVPGSGKLMDAVAGVLAAGCAVLVFGVVAFRLDDGDLRAILERLRQMTWFQPFNSLLQRVGTAGRVRAMNIENQQSGTGESRRHARLMTARERQGALGSGVAAGSAGGFAVFNSSNQAGTAGLGLLLLGVFVVGGGGPPSRA